MRAAEGRRNAIRRVVREVRAAIDDVRDGIVRKEWLDPHDELNQPEHASRDVSEREPERELVHVVAGQPGAQDDERDQEDVAAEADQLDEWILLKRKEQEHGPGGQHDDPRLQLLGTKTLPDRLTLPELRRLQAEHAAIEEQM